MQKISNIASHPAVQQERKIVNVFIVCILPSGHGYASDDPSAAYGEVFIPKKQIEYHDLRSGDEIEALVTRNADKYTNCEWFSLRCELVDGEEEEILQIEAVVEDVEPTPIVVETLAPVAQLSAIANTPDEDVVQDSFPTFEKAVLRECVLDIMSEINGEGETTLWTSRDLVERLVDEEHMSDIKGVAKLQTLIGVVLNESLDKRQLVMVEVRYGHTIRAYRKMWGLMGTMQSLFCQD